MALLAVLVLSGIGVVWLVLRSDEETVVLQSCTEVVPLYESYGFTIENWGRGTDGVPRLMFESNPVAGCNDILEGENVRLKKTLFLTVVAPLILMANESVRIERERLQLFRDVTDLSHDDANWLFEMCRKYKVDVPLGRDLIGEAVAELLMRVDTVPLSLALAQAVQESGWGTSRFFLSGNALFGQRVWHEHGMVPDDPAADAPEFSVRPFHSMLESIDAYILNLNSHPPYGGFRRLRAALRSAGKPLRGLDLIDELESYSEGGSDYIAAIKRIINSNGIADADDAWLREGKTIRVRYDKAVMEEYLSGMLPEFRNAA